MNTQPEIVPWTVSPGRRIETPDGHFQLVYSENPRTHERSYDPTKLDALTHRIAALPVLIDTLTKCQRWFERFDPTADLITVGTAELPMRTDVRRVLGTVGVDISRCGKGGAR